MATSLTRPGPARLAVLMLLAGAFASVVADGRGSLPSEVTVQYQGKNYSESNFWALL